METSIHTRSSNIELFRILLMLSIVAHHYVVNSGVYEIVSRPPYGWNDYFLMLWGMWGKIAINCFVLITGYYMCKSNISIRKFIKLFLEVLFYNVICYCCFCFSGYETFSIRGMLHAFNPINSVTDLFVGCFLVYYLLIPFINILVQHLTKKQHQILIAICILFTVIMPHVSRYEFWFNYVEWFTILHIIASYIRFYYGDKMEKINNMSQWFILGGISIGMLSVLIRMYGYEHGIAKMRDMYAMVMDCNAILAVITSVMLFIGFKTMNIGQSKIINGIASSTFAVLLIHANSDSMRRWPWNDVCHNVDWISSPYLLLHAIGCVFTIYIACIVIDKIRIVLFEKPTFMLVDKILTRYGVK